MVTVRPNEAQLAEKRADIPARWAKNLDTHDKGSYPESVNMLEGLTEEEADTFLQENPTLVPLYEIDVVKEAEPYQISD
jgi:hypothetical protein